MIFAGKAGDVSPSLRCLKVGKMVTKNPASKKAARKGRVKIFSSFEVRKDNTNGR